MSLAFNKLAVATGLAFALAAQVAMAAPIITTVFGMASYSTEVNQGDPALDPAVRDFDNSLRSLRGIEPVPAITSFLGGLSSYFKEEFACSATGGVCSTDLVDVNNNTRETSAFANGKVTSNGLGLLATQAAAGGNYFGRFDTSLDPPAVGAWVESTNEFIIDLGADANAFALYLVDLGDYGAVMTMKISGSNGSATIDVGTVINGKKLNPGPGDVDQGALPACPTNPTQCTSETPFDDGQLLFFGVYADMTFDTITLLIDKSYCSTLSGDPQDVCNEDAVGLDSLIYGLQRTDNPAPEPGSLLLLGLGLGAAGLARKRRRGQA